MTERRQILRAFHAANPGVTARAFGRGGSYGRLAARVIEVLAGMNDVRREAPHANALRVEPACANPLRAATPDALDLGGANPARAATRCVLDLACGDGVLLAELAELRAIGLDVSREELALAKSAVVQGRAQALPFADAAFDVIACHLAFMLFDDIEHVVREIGRVLRPGGSFLALLGGGPTAHGDDAFHRFLSLLPPSAHRFGDPRAKTEAGWRELFAGWETPPFERWELDLGGTFEQVWAVLGTSYELPHDRAHAIRAALEAATADLGGNGRIPCRVVTWLAAARSPRRS